MIAGSRLMTKHEIITRLAEMFCELEIESFKSLMKKQSLDIFQLEERYLPGRYCLLTLNGDISAKFFSDHLNRSALKLMNPKDLDSFIKQVNNKMNDWLAVERDSFTFLAS